MLLATQPSYFALILKTFAVLLGVLLLAWAALRVNKHLEASFPQRGIKILTKTHLSARSSLAVISIAERHFLIGVGDGTSPTLLSELSQEDIENLETKGKTKGFKATLNALRDSKDDVPKE